MGGNKEGALEGNALKHTGARIQTRIDSQQSGDERGLTSLLKHCIKINSKHIQVQDKRSKITNCKGTGRK